jgi:hypothetical protein
MTTYDKLSDQQLIDMLGKLKLLPDNSCDYDLFIEKLQNDLNFGYHSTVSLLNDIKCQLADQYDHFWESLDSLLKDQILEVITQK